MKSLESPARRLNHRVLRRAGVWLAVLVSAVVVVASAGAWMQDYVLSETYSAGEIGSSAFNASLTYNLVDFYSLQGLPQMGTRYRRTDGSAYAFIWSNTGYLFDSRTISYGQAQCKANDGNGYDVFIFACETSNQ